MQELLEWMEYIEDTRQQTKVRHTLKDILVIVLFATLANADDWIEMALFAESYQDYTLFLHGVRKMDFVWDRKQSKKKAMK